MSDSLSVSGINSATDIVTREFSGECESLRVSYSVCECRERCECQSAGRHASWQEGKGGKQASKQAGCL